MQAADSAEILALRIARMKVRCMAALKRNRYDGPPRASFSTEQVWNFGELGSGFLLRGMPQKANAAID
jgi:hypothetical protein